MLWKKFHQTLSLSEKHAELGFSPLALWMQVLVNADTKGRYTTDLRIIRTQTIPLYENVTDQMINDALKVLKDLGLIHTYAVGEKGYLVFHDHEATNPTGNLKHQRPRWPAPPADLCPCVADPAAAPPKGGKPPSEEDRLFALALEAKIIGSPVLIRQHIAGWIESHGVAKAENVLRSQAVRGRGIFEIHDTVFARKKLDAPGAFVKCDACGTPNAREVKNATAPVILGPCRACGAKAVSA